MLFSALSRGSFEGPVAGSDVTVVPQDNGTREDMEGVLLDPLVVVALVKLVAFRRMPEEAGSLTDFGTDGVIEAPVTSGAELVVVGALELLEYGGTVLDRCADCGDRTVAAGSLRNRALEPAELASVPACSGSVVARPPS